MFSLRAQIWLSIFVIQEIFSLLFSVGVWIVRIDNRGGEGGEGGGGGGGGGVREGRRRLKRDGGA